MDKAIISITICVGRQISKCGYEALLNNDNRAIWRRIAFGFKGYGQWWVCVQGHLFPAVAVWDEWLKLSLSTERSVIGGMKKWKVLKKRSPAQLSGGCFFRLYLKHAFQ